MSRIRSTFIPLVTFILCIPIQVYALSIGDVLPNSTGKTIQGEELSFSTLKGKVVYVDFWASWCPPCRKTLPWMNTLVESFPSSALSVVAVNLDADRTQVDRALAGVTPKFTVVLDQEKKVVAQFAPPKMPTSYLFTQEGKLIAVFAGFKEGDEKVIEEKIKSLL